LYLQGERPPFSYFSHVLVSTVKWVIGLLRELVCVLFSRESNHEIAPCGMVYGHSGCYLVFWISYSLGP
jgi:hypothetical protein